MKLAAIIERYAPRLLAQFGDRLLPEQLRAMEAIKRCRTPAAGKVIWQCGDCAELHPHPLSCGHRSCPQCQNHEATVWLDRQRAKQLPAEYFMVTFTLPYELRSLAWAHQKSVYDLLLRTAADTLKSFGLNSRQLRGELGLLCVLHTHSRRLDFHPHCHVLVPGGAVDRARRQWKKVKGKYLFNEFALAKVFRARFLAAATAARLTVPANPSKWVVDCRHVGHGQPALEYLSRYLYRGVLREECIVADRGGQVTFRYTDAATGQTELRTLPGEQFLWLLLQHVLPKGFRRVREHGFLHGNAKQLLTLLRWVLRVVLTAAPPKPRPTVNCPCCGSPMQILRVCGPGGEFG